MNTLKEQFSDMSELTEEDLYKLFKQSFEDYRYIQLRNFLNDRGLKIEYDKNLKKKDGTSISGYINLKDNIISVNWLDSFLGEFWFLSKNGALGDIYSKYPVVIPMGMKDLMLYAVLKVLTHEYKHFLQSKEEDNLNAMLNLDNPEYKNKITILEADADEYEERTNEYFMHGNIEILL